MRKIERIAQGIIFLLGIGFVIYSYISATVTGASHAEEMSTILSFVLSALIFISIIRFYQTEFK